MLILTSMFSLLAAIPGGSVKETCVVDQHVDAVIFINKTLVYRKCAPNSEDIYPIVHEESLHEAQQKIESACETKD
ncbi:MAG: hypothetical protein S4CHLAM81_11290 [Chlamydiales bacterium]|nr:hypothetical protein [Chlamydiales bacterium]MCH9635907.1 hypothetical protein [Chlamydiales bacterium]